MWLFTGSDKAAETLHIEDAQGVGFRDWNGQAR